MSNEDWLRAFEALEIELGREPTEEEIREWLADEANTIYDFDGDATDREIEEMFYGEYEDDLPDGWED